MRTIGQTGFDDKKGEIKMFIWIKAFFFAVGGLQDRYWTYLKTLHDEHFLKGIFVIWAGWFMPLFFLTYIPIWILTAPFRFPYRAFKVLAEEHSKQQQKILESGEYSSEAGAVSLADEIKKT